MRLLQPAAFLRAFAGAFFNDVFVEDFTLGCIISVNIVFWWRCISALQQPRAAPAQVFTVLSHRLSQAFFAISNLVSKNFVVTIK